MSLDALKDAMPAYAKDVKLNIGSVIGTSTLPPQRLWGTVLATAMVARNALALHEFDEVVRKELTPEAYEAAKIAGAIMAMNNVYYRAKHLLAEAGIGEYEDIPARLRMQGLASHGVDKADFELWCFAASAVNGCGSCLASHERVVREAGVPRDHLHDALRIASVVASVATVLDAEEALATDG